MIESLGARYRGRADTENLFQKNHMDIGAVESTAPFARKKTKAAREIRTAFARHFRMLLVDIGLLASWALALILVLVLLLPGLQIFAPALLALLALLILLTLALLALALLPLPTLLSLTAGLVHVISHENFSMHRCQLSPCITTG